MRHAKMFDAPRGTPGGVRDLPRDRSPGPSSPCGRTPPDPRRGHLPLLRRGDGYSVLRALLAGGPRAEYGVMQFDHLMHWVPELDAAVRDYQRGGGECGEQG
jgi:hypothetical protein